MIRQRVTRHGAILPLAPHTELAGCCMDRELIGVPKEGPVGNWLQSRQLWDSRYAAAKMRVHKKRIKDASVGYETFGDGEFPPPSALAGRRRIGADMSDKTKKHRGYGLSLWSQWGSKHDEAAVAREHEAEKLLGVKTATGEEGSGARPCGEIETQEAAKAPRGVSRSRSGRRIVTDEMQVEQGNANDDKAIADLLDLEQEANGEPRSRPVLPTPDYEPDTRVAGRRPYVGGIAVPFSLKKEAETASMVTLNSALDGSRTEPPRPMSPAALRPAYGKREPDEAEVAQRPPMEPFVAAAEVFPRASSRDA